jgi:hypothetical protein
MHGALAFRRRVFFTRIVVRIARPGGSPVYLPAVSR